ncbi:hypothetical protein F1C16_22330 (plasmid) [Hymenobacter sp. NBH84]|uniref:hypothetical protein n=1 Tax=Hymenobacter sp. NBH84 TaxID=2596915 RepID=UPI001624E036|nr:hypothetical protein [Hymenobacter sp. NBH84]QNE42361.1 hypothetical protein F1C16_22330 [Hymenobacter sp. NBH84]
MATIWASLNRPFFISQSSGRERYAFLYSQLALDSGEAYKKVGAAVRLSARDLFNPTALRQLQTEYAQAMAPYGLQRGVIYSTAIHEDVRRYYGAQKTTQRELAHVLIPIVHTLLEVTKKAWYVDSGVHLQRELERLNHQAAQQLEQANTRLAEVATIATANTLARIGRGCWKNSWPPVRPSTSRPRCY